MEDINNLLQKITKNGKNESLKDGFQAHRAILAYASGDKEMLGVIAEEYANMPDQIIDDEKPDLLH